MSQPILLIDIGNTNTKYGLASDSGIVNTFVLPTDLAVTEDAIGFAVLNACRFLKVNPSDIKAWVVSSVVPPLDPLFRQAGKKFCGCDVFFVPENIPLPLKNHYAKPEEVGADRLVTAFAARQLFITPGLIVIDFGTATTFDCVAHDVYLGGLICPGLLSSLRALGSQTAKLPRINLELASPELEFGKSTAESLRQGFLFGFAGLVDGLCDRLGKKLPKPLTVVATGGFAPKLQPVCPCLTEIRPDLLLQGLRLAYEQHPIKTSTVKK